MAYQVLARKWRPQRFDDVVGQEAVTRTLRNAIASGRLAHAFVFAGSRGCGKTTTARILSRALNCVKGPTADPCGECDACVEIAQGRDIDVLEIDAASHTGIDNIREVVIAGLAIAPVRDRYKIFIIDEVHQLSVASFNALLKSIEEPPAHVVFMMATTELHKIPDTILSRSQVFEFRTIPLKAIADQLRRIAAAEKVEISDAALVLISRSAEGSMRDAQSALDQVMAFAGSSISVDDVSTVLGLVGRDLLLDMVESVFDEDGPRAFALADRAVESGHDLRLVVRELSRVARDMMILSVDPSRAGDGELGEGEAERLTALSRRCSREDLMRAFDLLSKAEQEIRAASHPRYYFEMALLRWMHLRKLVPLIDLLEGSGSAPTGRRIAPTGSQVAPTSASRPAPTNVRELAPTADTVAPASALKDALLAEIRSVKNTLYSLAVAQAQRIDVTEDRITFTFASNQNVARGQLEQNRAWLESVAERLSGKRMPVTAVQSSDTASPPAGASAAPANPPPKRDLKAEALASTGVQALLDVFPAEIREVEEIDS
ncbi:MAG TPA: DNA polymerase III subunit gamma/tau [Vicinamibacterales bacterium]|nr:DNA polymerase III subunit gamma/tau [Vicinamibacterales bacterium]